MGNIVITAILIAGAFCAMKKMMRDKKSGKSIHCGGDCSRCGGGCH